MEVLLQHKVWLVKLGKYFINNTRKDRIPKSDLIKLIEEIDGVDSVSIQIIGEANEASAIKNPTSVNPSLANTLFTL